MARRKITKDMLVAAQGRGWTISQTARQYEFDPTSISEACDRFEVTLPRLWGKKKSTASTTKVKAFSASPAAIERAMSRNGA